MGQFQQSLLQVALFVFIVKVPDRSFLDLVIDLDYETSASNNLDKLVRPFALSPKHLQT